MNSVSTGLVLIPGAVALLVLLVFTYLYEQNRHSYFRAWQLAWAAFTLHYALEAAAHFSGPSAVLFFLSSLLLVVMAICIFFSTRLMKEPFQVKWYDVALVTSGTLLAYFNLRAHFVGGVFSESATPPPMAASSAASCAGTGLVAAATHARDASGSAVSIDLVRNASTGISMAADQSSPSASGSHGGPAGLPPTAPVRIRTP